MKRTKFYRGISKNPPYRLSPCIQFVKNFTWKWVQPMNFTFHPNLNFTVLYVPRSWIDRRYYALSLEAHRFYLWCHFVRPLMLMFLWTALYCRNFKFYCQISTFSKLICNLLNLPIKVFTLSLKKIQKGIWRHPVWSETSCEEWRTKKRLRNRLNIQNYVFSKTSWS